MAVYDGYNSTAWQRSLNTTTAKHLKEEELNMLRAFKFGALLEDSGNVLMNQGGEGFTWPIRFKNHEVSGTTGETARNFARMNPFKTAALPYRGYIATDMIYYKETRSNSGEEAIVKVVDGFEDRIKDSLKQALATEFYIDGNASGNETSWHGLESGFGTNGTVNVSTGAQRSANADDLVGYPSDTYATLSTELGSEGGENESGAVWPYGVADAHYDWNTPLIVCYNSTAFNGSANTWAGQSFEAMSFLLTHAARNQVENATDTILLNRVLFWQLKTRLRAAERINVSDSLKLRSLGFKDTIEFDGIEVGSENAIPAGVGYGFNIKNHELRCMDPEMYRVQGPVYDIDNDAFKSAVSTLSNMRTNSYRNVQKLLTIAS